MAAANVALDVASAPRVTLPAICAANVAFGLGGGSSVTLTTFPPANRVAEPQTVKALLAA